MILNKEKIDGGQLLTNGKVYSVKKEHIFGFFIEADNGIELYIASYESEFFSKLIN